MMLRPLFRIATILLLGLTVQARAEASNGQTAAAFMQHLVAETNATLQAEDLSREEKSARLVNLVDPLLDYEAFATQSLGAYSERLSSSQREEYERLLRQSILNYFGQQMMFYRKQPIELEQVIAVAHADDYFAVVQGQYAASFGPSNRNRERRVMRYLLRPVDGDWKIVRMRVGGVDFAGNLAAQVDAVLSEGRSVEALLDVLRKSTARKQADS